MKRRLRLVLLFVLLAVTLAWALTDTQRATSDNSSFESASWDLTSGTACNATTCYTGIDDGSGATCTTEPTNGDTDYVHSATSSAKQGFNVTTGISVGGSSITNAQFNLCQRRESSPSPVITYKLLHNTSEIGAGCSITASSTTYIDQTCNYAVTETFTAGDTFGFTFLKDANTRPIRISGATMILTYTLPAGGPKRVYITTTRPISTIRGGTR